MTEKVDPIIMDNSDYVSQTEAKQHLGELVKRVAYGGERIVLAFRGRPQAAIVSMADLEALERGGASDALTLKVREPVAEYTTDSRTRLEAIKRLPEPDRTRLILDELRVIGRRAAARGGTGSDVVRDDLEEIREERANHLADLS